MITRLILAWKIRRIEAALKTLVLLMDVQPEIWSLGAYYLDPRHLVFVIAVHTDAEKERLKSDAGFQARMREFARYL